MGCRWLLALSLVLAGTSAQKLFFKSNRLLQKEIQQYEQDIEKEVRGFGFKEVKHYFTGPRSSQENVPKIPANVVVCPGNKSACPDGNTCCITTTMGYGCCPLPMAMCCQDRRHCCPAKTRCDVARQACIAGDIVVPWFEKTSAISLEENKGAKGATVVCPDREHECPDDQTCCKSVDEYSCCPLPNAVCCSDEVHCCPSGTTCDVSHSRCIKSETGEFLNWFEKRPSQRVAKHNVASIQTDNTRMIVAANADSVRCDDSHICPTGNTCCRLQDNSWGCCPKPQAVCCSDGAHCCPHGTTCDVSSGKCNNGNVLIDWFVKSPAKKVGMVKCDGTHGCPDENTCCKLGSGQWGCCPLPEAVCCSDGVHCCPDGTTCDLSSGKCNRGNELIDWFVKTPAKKAEMVKCDNEHECPSENTCCKLNSGQWGCCPLPKAVCCSDGVHCCPDGTTCDVSSGKCNRGTELIDWFVKSPARKVEMVKCDNEHECPSENTCCKLESGQWGCCPLPKAVCCSDGVHCCPDGTTCDVSSGKCNRGNELIDWFVKSPARKVGMVKCDNEHECPSENTCCKLESGQWGCCPLPKAVCCSDGVHCCPDGTTCDVSSGKCNRGNELIDWFVKSPARKVGMVKCDNEHECPSENTCCKLESGQWGCCPLPKAVCCSDGVHCCPDGTTCDVSSGKCNRGTELIDWFVKSPARKVEMVKCDNEHECPSENTCCKLESGQWGCCPLPKAVCCSDGVHCCPDGTTCDVSSGKCNRGNELIDWFVKTPAKKAEMVKCDNEHECPSENTCCKLNSGQWGCCPLPKAVCCSDGVHCCPDGTTCDLSSGKCNRGKLQIDWFVKSPAKKVGMVKCDNEHECPSENTCCKLESGQWGCCPLPKAVCCSDGVHCCPDGTTCDVSSGKCNRGNELIDWFVKTPAKKVGMVKCDSTHDCPDENTCCKLGSGQWGCCPLPEAVCCSDGVHCCPDGTTCDLSSGKCNQGNQLIDWFVKSPARKVEMVKCDNEHECPSENTCCKLESGQWGCCPLPKAVCCSDGVHCCPDGTTCDVSSGKCNRGNELIDWFVKSPAKKVEMVKCDNEHECPSENTCCKLESGQWGCCPLPKAVCCSDGVHCCPDGTTCDVSSGKCNRGNELIDWYVKSPAKKVGMVKCDNEHECPSENTCCKLESGQWGCCPLPKAVCCSDGVHCCPDGTTCDVSSGKCNRENELIEWFVKSPARKVEMVKCDNEHECPSENTCCKLESGQWGCCPLPKAVCCSDGVHCCPDGTTCDVSSGKCNRGYDMIDWFVKTQAKKVGMVRCDSTHECPDENTCCKLGSGQWGCCPLPEAVCCSDGVHCCPDGTTCDLSTGKCNRGKIQIDWFAKSPAIEKLSDVICPDGSECQDGQTCCEMDESNSGITSYGCCPLPNAVCCNDGQHCCPQSYRCDLKSGVCVRGYRKLPLFRTLKRNSLTNEDIWQRIENIHQNVEDISNTQNFKNDLQATSVKCSDGTECPDEYSCCSNGQGGYNCCPMPNGVCCDDNKHCCPHGYICDEGPGICRIPETTRTASNFISKINTRKNKSVP